MKRVLIHRVLPAVIVFDILAASFALSYADAAFKANERRLCWLMVIA